jgi:glycosyltransferase involved in cell wall biosynthesis
MRGFQTALSEKSKAKRALFIRSDLRSRTGYARAARALIELIPNSYSVFGVDIHPDPNDCAQLPAVPIIDDATLFTMVREATVRPIVLHYTGPDDFVHVAGAYNVGCFYWETAAIPFVRAWPIKLNFMDAIWSPTTFVAEFIRSAGFEGPTGTVTWPHDFSFIPDRAVGKPVELDVQTVPFILHQRNELSYLPLSFDKLRQQSKNLFFVVQSVAPRKGTRLLLKEWRDYILSGHPNDILLLRLSFRHSADIYNDAQAYFAEMMRDAGFRPGEMPQVAVITEAISDSLMQHLFRRCDAFVSATFGEGFGGPIIEALQQGCPVIVPRHTGIADLVAANYPLAIPTHSAIVGLMGGIPAYPPSSNWHIPVPGAVCQKLQEFAAMPPRTRGKITEDARAHASQFCSLNTVRRHVAAELTKLVTAGLAPAKTLM